MAYKIVRQVAKVGLWPLLLLFSVACQMGESVPTRVQMAQVPLAEQTVPSTWTPQPVTPTVTSSPLPPLAERPPTETPLPVPTITPVTPSPTPSVTPFPLVSRPPSNYKPLGAYGTDEIIPLDAFPKPPDDNGWGIHWVPTVSQEPEVVDRFVAELVRMHIKWVVFLNDGTNIGSNDYLVDRLVGAGIMPVMRIYRSNILPYDGDLGAMVAHYRRRGVYYFQLYNEPNANVENSQGFSNPNQYARAWANAARDVVANGGLPGIGALSPGGEYNHFTFLSRTFEALEYTGDTWLLNHAWLSIHNYHGVRQLDDPGGFLLFRAYDEIVRAHLGRSLPMIGTEGGSYSDNPQVEKDLLIYQYTYMRQAEPYFFAFSYWLLANQEGGAWDPNWEWQSLFSGGGVHPLVTDFFYRTPE